MSKWLVGVAIASLLALSPVMTSMPKAQLVICMPGNDCRGDPNYRGRTPNDVIRQREREAEQRHAEAQRLQQQQRVADAQRAQAQADRIASLRATAEDLRRTAANRRANAAREAEQRREDEACRAHQRSGRPGSCASQQ